MLTALFQIPPLRHFWRYSNTATAPPRALFQYTAADGVISHTAITYRYQALYRVSQKKRPIAISWVCPTLYTCLHIVMCYSNNFLISVTGYRSIWECSRFIEHSLSPLVGGFFDCSLRRHSAYICGLILAISYHVNNHSTDKSKVSID